MSDAIDLYVFWLGMGGMFAICAGLMYVLLLVSHAWQYRIRGYGWIESFKKAQRILT